MRTVAEAMEFIRVMTTVALGAIDKEQLRTALAILMEGAQTQGTDLTSDDPLAQSIRAANAMAALLGIVEPEEEDAPQLDEDSGPPILRDPKDRRSPKQQRLRGLLSDIGAGDGFGPSTPSGITEDTELSSK